MCHKQSDILLEKGLINPASSLHQAIFCCECPKNPNHCGEFCGKENSVQWRYWGFSCISLQMGSICSLDYVKVDSMIKKAS